MLEDLLMDRRARQVAAHRASGDAGYTDSRNLDLWRGLVHYYL